jgi:CheY-like chemotaxis protein
VLGMTTLLFDTPLSPEQLECATIVQESAEHLMHVIDDILDFSKIEAGKLHMESVPFELADVLEQALAIVGPAATRQGLVLRADLPRVPLPPLLGDPHRLRQVRINLLGNAVKFTKTGGVTLRLSPREVANGSAAVRIEVIDTGIGIEPAARERLFRAFEQADGSMTRRFGGTGLGLAITRQLVELMGGQVGVTSEPGAGSTFTIYLPAHQADVETVAAHPPHAPVRGGAEKVLLVEDEALVRQLTHEILRRNGYRVLEAADGVEALAVVRDHADRIDLMLTDVVMPRMSGHELVELARPVRPDMRILYVSGYSEEAIARQGQLTEGIQLLSKPFTPGVLTAKIRELLDRTT